MNSPDSSLAETQAQRATPAPAESTAEPTVSRRQFLNLFTAVMLPMFMAMVDQTLLATSTPKIAAEFGKLHDTSWIVTAYMLCSVVTVPIYGRLGDRYGRLRILFIALGIF